MAENQRVFVSPGVYTAEKDLTFVAQSVGVTALGVAGETLKGPAFEPIFITSFDEFRTRFGETSAEKFVDSQIPKYELSFIARSYLQQSNQLFVTRVLGLSGYDAGPSWSITTIGEMDLTSVFSAATGLTTANWNQTLYVPLTGSSVNSSNVFTDSGFTSPLSSVTTFGGSNFTLNGYQLTGETFINGQGQSLGTFVDEVSKFIYEGILDSDTTSFTGSNANNIYYYGFVPTACSEALSGQVTTWTGELPVISNRLGINSNINTGDSSTFTSDSNDGWYNTLFEYSTDCVNNTYSGVSFNMAASTAFTATSAVTYLQVELSGCFSTYQSILADQEAHNMVVATLRSRGLSTLSSGGPVYEISGDSTGDVTIDCTGEYSEVLNDPFETFGLSAITDAGIIHTFNVSFSTGSKNYLPRVLGRRVFDREAQEVPIFVEEIYPNILQYLYRTQKVRGINCCISYLPAARFNNNNLTSIGWYMNEFQTPRTPWVVSELRGNDVDTLFRFISVSDGTAANREYKISLINISFERQEFDIIIRDFFDTDANPVVLEKYTRCSLNPSLPSFIGRKIGTSDGEYELKSRFTMLELTEDVLNGDLSSALPCGFEGYPLRNYEVGTITPYPQWKTKYYQPGELVFDPYFDGSGGLTNSVISAGDNIRRNFLGFSDGTGAAIDFDFFEYKGYRTPSSVCTDTTGDDWSVLTKGFHMDSGATVVIAGSGSYVTLSSTTLSGQPMFQVGAAQFRGEPTSTSDPYYTLQSRKFTLVPHGGFDGWDEYRKTRTNTDAYRLGLTGFLNGTCSSTDFPDGVGDGAFKKISSTEANTDYYAYRRGIHTFENPEAVNINLLTTPGIDYVNNLGLVNDTIDMVENDRADSLYITTTPDYNLFTSSSNDPLSKINPTEAVLNLEDSFIDSNYTATYYPWIQVRDNNSNRQLYIPPTAEVVRNMALTDNIAFPWFASAGYTRGIVNAIKARTKLTLDDRDSLYLGRLNPIATFSDVGPIIFGNKTLQIRESALDRINVRRLLLQTRKLISAVAVRLLFEQNDDIVRQQFLDLVNPILDSIRRDRGLTDFRVVLSNDPEEIDRNELNGKIYIKPTRALEFIFIEFLITPTGASFEDI